MLLNTFDSTWVQGTGCQKFVKEDADDKDVKVQIVDVARRDPNDLKSTSGTVVFLRSLIICWTVQNTDAEEISMAKKVIVNKERLVNAIARKWWLKAMQLE